MSKYEDKTLEDLYQEMKRLDTQWHERYSKMAQVRGVVMSAPDGNRWMQITDVDYTDEGIVVYVQ